MYNITLYNNIITIIKQTKKNHMPIVFRIYSEKEIL